MTIHGHKRFGRESKHYARWRNMHRRCSNPTHRQYPSYGGRGIYVDERWQEFKNFLEDMGECPEGYSLERIDNNGPYAPWNCRWATKGEQVRNTRRTIMVEVNGQRMVLKDACSCLGLKYNTIHNRIQRHGIEPQVALTLPLHKHFSKAKNASSLEGSPT